MPGPPHGPGGRPGLSVRRPGQAPRQCEQRARFSALKTKSEAPLTRGCSAGIPERTQHRGSLCDSTGTAYRDARALLRERR